jgi:uncharacterized membrane protein YebE (DUF533 family)
MDFDIENLIGTMIGGTLQTRRKRSYGAGRFLAGGSRSFVSASTLLTVGGLIWGVIETMQQQSASGQPAPPPRPMAAPPPLPGAGPAVPPPIPGQTVAPVDTSAIPSGAARLVRLLISAARADGEFSPVEQDAVLAKAREVGAESLVASELARPTPLASLVAGISDPSQRADLYTLAFAIVRADESVTGAERIYLAQLATLLGLDRDKAERLERDAVEKIAAQG